MLISVSKAEQLICEALPEPKTATIPLIHANNLILAVAIIAKRDYPPFHRITKDGIALSSSCFTGYGQRMKLSGYAQAGKPQAVLEDATMAIEVATGAPLPRGTDAVIPYEEVEKQAGTVILNTDHVSVGQNIHSQANDCRKGDVLIKKGTIIGSPEIAILGSNGIQSVEVYTKPRIAIVTTGDELVAVDSNIKPHQLYRSNDVMLLAALQGHGFASIHYTHVPDDASRLYSELAKTLDAVDVVLISGGVSKGAYDFIPEVLKKIAVKKIFHGVSQRPGKPLWFGRKGRKLVFGLPGNPVSALTCTLRYVIPAVKKLSGYSESHCATKTLGEAVDINVPLTVFMPVKVNANNEVVPVSHNGSGDFISLAESSGFIELPGETNHFYAGERYRFIPWRASCPC